MGIRVWVRDYTQSTNLVPRLTYVSIIATAVASGNETGGRSSEKSKELSFHVTWLHPASRITTAVSMVTSVQAEIIYILSLVQGSLDSFPDLHV